MIEGETNKKGKNSIIEIFNCISQDINFNPLAQPQTVIKPGF
jgi:hypothetical protein